MKTKLNLRSIIKGNTFIAVFLFVTIIMTVLTSCGSAKKEFEHTAKLTVSCESLMQNLETIAEEKRDLLPQSGFVIESEDVGFDSGESVFDLLSRELKNRKIHFDYQTAPVTETVYIKGINNIYETDAGAMSGWLFTVNGELPSVSINEIKLEAGDEIVVFYSTDFMVDMEKFAG